MVLFCFLVCKLNAAGKAKYLFPKVSGARKFKLPRDHQYLNPLLEGKERRGIEVVQPFKYITRGRCMIMPY